MMKLEKVMKYCDAIILNKLAIVPYFFVLTAKPATCEVVLKCGSYMFPLLNPCTTIID